MAFKGIRPPGQPRTLRSTAEDKGVAPANLIDGGAAPGSGMPDFIRGANETYVDHAAGAVQSAPRSTLNPSPFASIRKGR